MKHRQPIRRVSTAETLDPSEEYKIFGQLLAGFRKKKGKTQTDVARAIGTSQVFLVKVERRGERKLDVIELMDLLDVMGVDVMLFVRALRKALEDARHGSQPGAEGPKPQRSQSRLRNTAQKRQKPHRAIRTQKR